MMHSSPSISQSEKQLLQIVSAIANADGELSPAEADFMVEEFALLYAHEPDQKPLLRQEIQSYLSHQIPVPELVSQLGTIEERELALKLCYMIIQVGQSESGKSQIVPSEKVAYRNLVQLLAIPSTTIEMIEWEADRELSEYTNRFQALIARFAEFFGRQRA